MARDPVRVNFVRTLDATIVQLARDRAEVQRRLAKQASRLAGVDLGYSALYIFETLGEKGLRVTELAEVLQAPPSTITRQIQSLESQGLIDRLADEQDGRASIVKLSTEGMRVADAIEGLRIERLERSLNGMSMDELRVVNTLFERLGAALREE